MPGVLVLVLDVFPNAEPTALFSDAVDYRFRLRPVTIPGPAATAFAVSDDEYVVSCRFAAPVQRPGDGPLVQEGTCVTSTGQAVSFRVNDEEGGSADGLRVFAGRRLDPFFFDGVRAVQTIVTRQLAVREPRGQQAAPPECLEHRHRGRGRHGDRRRCRAAVRRRGGNSARGFDDDRLERFGRPEIKNISLFPNAFDPVNRAIDIRDLYNQEDAFSLGPTYLAAYRARLNANLAFYDGLDGKTDWPLGPDGAHPLTELLLADFMVVDVSKPFAEDGYFEIERAPQR